MILQNEARCKACDDVIFSRHRHDFVSCKCGAVTLDGGMSYLRRVGRDLSLVEERCIEIPDEAGHAAIEAIRWAHDTGRNELGVLCAVARALRDHGVQLCV